MCVLIVSDPTAVNQCGLSSFGVQGLAWGKALSA